MAGGHPTSEQLAQAVICAARATGEGDALLPAAREGRWPAFGLTRARRQVLVALEIAYPKVGVRRMGWWLGIYLSPDYAKTFDAWRDEPWWSWGLLDALVQLVRP